ncbi:MAG: hypothetical protein R3D28_20225 [Geminicoccaceae bacterium]
MARNLGAEIAVLDRSGRLVLTPTGGDLLGRACCGLPIDRPSLAEVTDGERKLEFPRLDAGGDVGGGRSATLVVVRDITRLA